jgi:spectinomycin phosphotransferase
VSLAPGREHAEATAYRIDTDDGAYFLKLSAHGAGVGPLVARCLADAGISNVLAPMRTRDDQLAVRLDDRWATMYALFDGQNAFVSPLTREQWTQLGVALRAIHDRALPASISDTMRRESFPDTWRKRTREILATALNATWADDVSRLLVALLASKQRDITSLIEHAEHLAASMLAKASPFVPCHGDLHAGNVLVDAAGAIAIVDWDDPVMAPKERDLMFVGAGIGGAWNRPEESAAFYRGYGSAAVDAEAIAYYRCDRIVEDVAVFCDRLLHGGDDGAPERRLIFAKFAQAFEPDNVVEIAERSYAAL